MKLRKYARFAWIMSPLVLLMGLIWLGSSKKKLYNDDNFPAVIMISTGLALFIYLIRTAPMLNMKVYEDTKSLDNDLIYSDSADFELVRMGNFNFILALISAFGMLGLAMLSVFYWAWFLERPRFSRIKDAEEAIGMTLAVVVSVCVVQSFIYVLRTYDKKWVRN